MVLAATPTVPSVSMLIGFNIISFLLFFFFLLSGGECYEYKWFSGGNSTHPVTWCQRSDGLNVTGKKKTRLAVRYLTFVWKRAAAYCCVRDENQNTHLRKE